ncbi:hypothetical protein [Armatimonas rosea]|uniref:DUF4367 domain-containing protein n=1 Tax=Armatimonas rosea TaxID=685828 RepID=A0A7W9SRF3_ARMRO|nr:hypothetical protein [Armatimonas rosea]MBB6051446.1 hypothetical protein [Armatimonas rosea]
MRASWGAALCLSLGAAGSLPVAAQTATKAPPATKRGTHAISIAAKLGLPERVGAWRLVRHVPGEHAHFLYANQQRTFSLFVTETKNNRPLKPQTGWKPTVLGQGTSAFLHQDSRHSERNAIAFKSQTQRRMVVGRLTGLELVEIAKQLN